MLKFYHCEQFLLSMMLSIAAFPHPGGTTPLHLAASANNIECVTMLIWHGADYNAVDEYGRTSLYIAAQKSLEECVHAHLDNAIWKDILSLPAKDTGSDLLKFSFKGQMIKAIVKIYFSSNCALILCENFYFT